MHQDFSVNGEKYDPFDWSVLITEFNESYLLGKDIRNENGLLSRLSYTRPPESMPNEDARFKYLDRALNLCLNLKGYQYLGLKLDDVMSLDLATLMHLESKLQNYHPDKDEALAMQEIMRKAEKVKK